jgi:hypothetical protein
MLTAFVFLGEVCKLGAELNSWKELQKSCNLPQGTFMAAL